MPVTQTPDPNAAIEALTWLNEALLRLFRQRMPSAVKARFFLVLRP